MVDPMLMAAPLLNAQVDEEHLCDLQLTIMVEAFLLTCYEIAVWSKDSAAEVEAFWEHIERGVGGK